MSQHNEPNTAFELRTIAVKAYGPSLLFGIANGAVLPVIALSATELGVSVAMSALTVSLIGAGAVVGSLPAALIILRYGERRSLISASATCAAALLICFFLSHMLALVMGIFLYGLASSVLNLARQAYVIDIVPPYMRARGLASLGGAERIGIFVGPFAAAAVMKVAGLSATYWLGAVAMIFAGALCWSIRDTDDAVPPTIDVLPRLGLTSIMREHAKVLMTLGTGVLLVSAMRASRPLIIPLWANHIGMSAPAMALVYGIASAIDMLAFYPAGKIMDRYGRRWIAVPCATIMGVALVLLPLASDTTGFVLVCGLIGLGNGIGAGMVMTIGADSAPTKDRTQFLGVWKLLDDIGLGAGPIALSACTVLLSLGTGIVLMGGGGLVAAAIFWQYLPSRHGT